MKTKNVVIGVAALAIVVAGGAYVAVTQMEKKVEDQFRQSLTGLQLPSKASVGNVAFSYFSNTLVVENFEFATQFEGIDMQGTVAAMRMEGYNPSTLNPNAPKGEKMADYIEARDAKMQLSDGQNVKIDITMELTIMEDLAMNSARLVKAYTEDPMGQAYFDEVMDMTFSTSSIKNIDMTAYDREEKILFLHIGTSGITDYTGTQADSFFNDFVITTFLPTETGTVSIARMDMKGIAYPSAEQMRKINQISQTMKADPYAASNALVAIYKEIYLNQAFFRDFSMKELLVTEGGKPIEEIKSLADYHGTEYKTLFKMESMESALDYSNPLSAKLKIDNMAFDRDVFMEGFIHELLYLDKPTADAIKNMLDNPLSWSVDFDAKLGFQGQESDIRLDLSMPSVGAVSFNIGALLPSENLTALVNDKNFHWLEAPVSKVSMVYKDFGLLPMLILGLANEMDQTPTALLEEARADAVMMKDDPAYARLVDPMMAFLEKPGTLSVTADKLKDLSLLEAFFVILMLDPEELDIQIQVEQGQKPLLEYFPENLR